MTGFFSRMFDPPRRPGFFGGDLDLGSGASQDANADDASSADDTASTPQWSRSFFALDPNDLLFPPSALGSYFGSLARLNLVGGSPQTTPLSNPAQSALFPPDSSPLLGSLAPVTMGGSPSAMPLSYGAGSMPPSTPDDDETAVAVNGNDELALSLLGRMALQLRPQIRTNALSALRGLTGDQFTDQQRNEILDQIIDNIDDADAKEFRSIQTNNGTTALTPKQYAIVSQQIEMLSPEYRDKARAAFQQALHSGRVTCPQCR